MVSAAGVAAFFLDYLSPFIDAPAAFDGYGNGQAFGFAQYLTFTTLVVVAALFAWTRLGRIPAGLSRPSSPPPRSPTASSTTSRLASQLWPLAGAVVADAAVQWVAARRPHRVPVAIGALIPLLSGPPT